MAAMSHPPVPVGRTVLSVGVFWLGYFAVLFVASIPKGMVPPAWAEFVWGVLASLGVLGLTQVAVRRAPAPRALRGWEPPSAAPGRFLVGVVIGLALYAAMVGAAVAFADGHLIRTAGAGAGAITLTVAGILALALMEELGFRGYPLRALVPAIGSWPAQLLVAVAFALGHLTFGWSWQAVVFGVFPNALLFGAVALASGGLAMPVGLHAALNVARWAFGERETPGLWTLTIPDAMQPRVAALAPIAAVALTLLATLAVWVWDARHESGAARGARSSGR